MAARMIRAKISARRLRRERSGRTGSLLVAEAVADPAHGEDELRLLGIGLELLAQVPDVHVDRARVAIGRVAPHAREQHVAREHPAGAARHRAEDLELDERGLDELAAQLHRALGRIDPQAGGIDRRLGLAVAGRHAGAPQRGLHARAELPHRERLGDVVVGAELEPEDLVDLLALGAEHDDRDALPLGAQPPADLEAVHLGQHHVEHDEVEGLLGEARERLAPVRRVHDLIAVALEREGQERLDRLLVVDEEDARGTVGHAVCKRNHRCCGRLKGGGRYVGTVLDSRLYRAAFLPALIAVFVCAFSLTDRPAPATTPLAADAFDTSRAFGAPRQPPRDSLRELGATFPDRRPGSAGDGRLANRVERALRRTQFETARTVDSARTVDGTRDLVTVTGVRPGLSSRRIVVLANRDALAVPGLAELSGTAALLELARVFQVRELRKTLVLVSTSGGTGGSAGARLWAERNAGAPIDAVIVLGDMAGRRVRKPFVVPWSNGSAQPPIGLVRTLESAVRREVNSNPNPGGARASGQWARRALPFTVSGQGEPAAAGTPAVLLSVSGERGPAPRAPVRESRMAEMGRAVVRAVTAIDAAGAGEPTTLGPAFADEPGGIVTVRNVLPDWSVRLLIGCLLLPALLAALDGYFRARRRRLPVERWLGWVGALAAPFLLAWAWTRGLGLTGAVRAPGAPVLAAWDPAGTSGVAWAVSALLVWVLAWAFLRPWLVRRTGVRGSPAAGGAGAAIGALLGVVTLAVWLANPYAAALLLPAAHAWLFLASPGTRLRGWAAIVALAGGAAAPLLLAFHYARALGQNPLELLWSGFLAVAGGHFAPGTGLVLALWAACCAGLLQTLRARRRAAAHTPPEPIHTRGPITYAGPGSLGGTQSALRH